MSFIKNNSELKEKLNNFCEYLNNIPQINKFNKELDDFLLVEENNQLHENALKWEEMIEQKQLDGEEILEDDLNAFKDIHTKLNAQQGAEEFFNAQESLMSFMDEITSYITISLQLGRIPDEEEIESLTGESCGHSH